VTTAALAAPTLLVADGGNACVHELDVSTGTPMALPVSVLKLDTLHDPRARAGCPVSVAACATHIAVSCLSQHSTGLHFVLVVDAATHVPVRMIGGNAGGSSMSFLRPRGMWLSSNGSHVAVADSGNDRVALFRVRDGSMVGHVVTRVLCPMGVMK
jgi:hypothetical protein